MIRLLIFYDMVSAELENVSTFRIRITQIYLSNVGCAGNRYYRRIKYTFSPPIFTIHSLEMVVKELHHGLGRRIRQ
jgi:hypothetical protein